MNKKLFIIMILAGIFVAWLNVSAWALDTYYNNQTGYNNKIPYSAFFNGHSPQPEKIAVQKGRVQAVVPVNTKEVQVEQEGLEDEAKGIKE